MTDSNPTFSVILTTYNGEDFVSECIDSILNQKFTDFELIIADDNSTDSTYEIIDKYGNNHPSIKVLKRESNVGIPTNTNDAVDHASGHYLAFIDQDDLWRRDKLLRHYEKHNGEGVSVVYSDTTLIDSTGNEYKRVRHRDPEASAKEIVGDICRNGNFVRTMSAVTMTMSAWDSVNGFDQYLRVSADVDLWYRLADQESFAHLSMPLAEKRTHDENLSDRYRLIYQDNIYILHKMCLIYPFMDQKMKDSKKFRLYRHRSSHAFHNDNPLESIKYGVKALRINVEIAIIGFILLSVVDIITKRKGIGKKIYDVMNKFISREQKY